VIGLDASAPVLEQASALAETRAVDTVAFVAGDVYELAYDDASFDVVHAHQVLQHLGDPVAALREMHRVCRPDGVVAARDGDYAAFAWYPLDPVLDEWLALYRTLMRHNGAEPDAGRRLLHWARAAGFSQVTPSASVWCFATDEDREYWGGMWADRVVTSTFAEQAVHSGLSTRDDLQRMSDAFRAWMASADGWFLVPHGEILCRP
jgi:SAM-dependent methyltransferase